MHGPFHPIWQGDGPEKSLKMAPNRSKQTTAENRREKKHVSPAAPDKPRITALSLGNKDSDKNTA